MSAAHRRQQLLPQDLLLARCELRGLAGNSADLAGHKLQVLGTLHDWLVAASSTEAKRAMSMSAARSGSFSKR